MATILAKTYFEGYCTNTAKVNKVNGNPKPLYYNSQYYTGISLGIES